MMGSRPHEAQRAKLDGDLANATIRALRGAWGELSWSLFGDVLKAPTFVLGRSRTQLGRWDPRLRSIEISEPLLLEQGWGAAIEVLKHEMAHQFVHEQLGAYDEPSHGPLFRKICEERGIDARAAGDPSDAGAGHPVLDKIRKLLSLAQSPNEHEAQSAARVAQRLMLEHNIAQLDVERSDGFTSRQLGRTTGRTTEAERQLGTILQDHFFVDVIWVHAYRPLDGIHGRVMEVCGRRENVELADYVHDFITRTAERLWKEHKAARGIRKDRDRQAYLAGVMAGFRDQLDQQKTRQVEKGLVWLGDPELAAYFRRRHPSVSTRSYYERGSNPAREHGREAGRSIVLHRGVESAKQGGAPRQLGSGRRRG
jgi:hypothetical protein